MFLAEVIPASQSILEEECPAYCIIPGVEEDYFTAVMLHVSLLFKGASSRSVSR